jgi:hypothetical protein
VAGRHPVIPALIHGIGKPPQTGSPIRKTLRSSGCARPETCPEHEIKPIALNVALNAMAEMDDWQRAYRFEL